MRIAALAFVMLIAVLCRTAWLSTVPMGLNPDEALNGNESLTAHQAGQYPLFYPSNNGREGFFINLVGLSESLVGAGFLGLRIPSAIIGSLTVLFVFLLGCELVGWRAAVFGSFLLATSFWHLALSRAALRLNLVPLLLTSSLFLLMKALQEDSRDGVSTDGLWMAFAGGLLYGLGFHSYIAYRISPVVALAFAGIDLYRRRKCGESLRPWWAVMAVWWGTALFVALPMALYFIHHPLDFSHRMDQLSPLKRKHPVAAIWGGISMAVLQFNVRGDSDWMTNISSAPLLLWPVGILFVLGVALAVWTLMRRRKGVGTAVLLLVWLVTMLMPTVLSGDTSALRTIGDITPVFLLAGWAASWVYALLNNRWARGLFVAAVLATGAVDVYRYFGPWAHSAGAADDLHKQAAVTGLMLNKLPRDTPLYLTVDRNDEDYFVEHRNSDGSEISIPYTAGIVVLETRDRNEPTLLYEDEAAQRRFPRGSVIVQLYPSQDFFAKLKSSGVSLHTAVKDGVPYAVVE